MSKLNSTLQASGRMLPEGLACSLVLLSASAMAQTQAGVEPTVVTATRAPQAISRVLADVSYIGRDDIERQGGASAVADLLKTLPGFELARNGGPATTSSLFLRGAETRHVLVLIDGVRVDTQSASGGASWEAMPLAQIDHIEVVRGPASAIYGSDAVAGVVQIFTRKGQGPLSLDMGLGVGSQGLVSSDAQVAGSSGAWSYSLGVAGERASGFGARVNVVPGTAAADDDGYRTGNASARVAYAFNPRHSVSLSALRQHINSGYDAKVNSSADDRSIRDLDSAALTWAAQWWEDWRSTLTLGQSRDRYETRPAVYAAQTEAQNASWTNQLVRGEHTWRATLEGRQDRLLNSGLTTSPVAGEGTRRDGALGLGYAWQHEAYALQSAIREDHDSAFGSHVTGSLAGGLALNAQWRLRASWGTAFRAPTLYQRYSPYGQAGLMPEFSRTSELGVQYHDGSTQWGLTAYNSHVRDLIQFDAPGVCADTRNCYRNVGQARLQGLELSAEVSVVGVRLSGSASIDEPKNTQKDLMLARRARQHASLRAETLWAQWNLGVQMLASGKRYDDAANQIELGGYTTWGVDAQTALSPQIKLILRADNLTDKRYQSAFNYASAPRTIFVGVRWTPAY